MSNNIIKNSTYEKIKKESECIYIQKALEDNLIPIESCVSIAIDNNLEELLDCEEYESIDEDELLDIISEILCEEIDEVNLLKEVLPSNL